MDAVGKGCKVRPETSYGTFLREFETVVASLKRDREFCVDDHLVDDLSKALEVEECLEIKELDDDRGRLLRRIVTIRPFMNLKTLKLSHHADIGRHWEGCGDCWCMLEGIALGNLPNLEFLSLRSSDAVELEQPLALQPIVAAVDTGHLKGLKILELEGNVLEDRSMEALLQCLVWQGQLNSVKVIRLHGNQEPLYSFVEAFQVAMQTGYLENLEELTLRGDRRLGRQQLLCIAEGLRSGLVGKLQTLDLCWSWAWDGLGRLATAVQEGSIPQLKTLRMSRLRSKEDTELNSDLQLGEAFGSSFVSNVEMLRLDGFHGGILSTSLSWNLRALKSLHLGELEFVAEEHMATFAEALMDDRFPLLTDLHLPYFYPILAKALASGHSPDLEVLGFWSYCPFKSDICELMPSLSQLPKLLILIFDCMVTEEAAEELVRSYQINAFLTVELSIEWPRGNPWEENWRGFWERNCRQVADRRRLSGAKVPASQGRLFLCGEPSVGKTTLRKSLTHDRHLPFLIPGVSCLSPARNKQQTRGIEVRQISDEDFTLVLWDLAGQQEYHILHGTFFPDLAYNDAYATLFVIVCRANAKSNSMQDEAYEDLRYWLRFISASSFRSLAGAKRQVIIVLNRFENKPCDRVREWNLWLMQFREEFEDFLEIDFQMDLSCFDVRSPKKAKRFKQMLLFKTNEMLRYKEVPKICQDLQINFQIWAEEHRLFPVVSWDTIRKQYHLVPEETLVAAINYLHQVGALIHFPKAVLEQGGLPNSHLVVIQPEWFCIRVVGHLLLPEEMWKNGMEVHFQKRLDSDHTLAIHDLVQYYQELTEYEVRQTIAILVCMGLCFRVDQTKLLIPALVPRDISLPIWWTDQRHCQDSQWVMGFSLVPVDAKRTLLPKSLFSGFQVELAQDTEIRQRIGNDFCAGVAFVAFKALQMQILVEFQAEEKNAMTDRVDIMVKPSLQPGHEVMINPSQRRAEQVNFADALFQKLDAVRRRCCPGVQFQRAVIQPWSVADGHQSMTKRDVSVLVEDLKKELVSPDEKPGNELTEWHVRGQSVGKADLLSRGDLDGVTKELQRAAVQMTEATELSERLCTALGIFELPTKSETIHQYERMNSMPSPSAYDRGFRHDYRVQELLYRKVMQHDTMIKILDAKVRDLETEFRNMKEVLKRVRSKQQHLGDQLTTLEVTFLEERLNSVPRFVYFKPKSGSQEWINLRKLLTIGESCTLHLLCEARFDDHKLHEVENQKGYRISGTNEWAKRHAEWLKWSLVVLAAVTSVGAAAIPGFGVLVPALISAGTQLATTAIDEIRKSAMIESTIRVCTTKGKASEPGAKPTFAVGRAKLALEELLSNLTAPTFMEHFRLRRVRLFVPHRSFAEDRRECVVWICDDCFPKYMSHRKVEEI